MRKRTLLCLCSLGLVCLYAGVSASVAWYAAEGFLTVSQTRLSLSAAKLQIGVQRDDEVHYQDHLNPEDLVSLCPAFFQSQELGDVSGMMRERWADPNIPELYSLTGKKAKEGSYMQFTLSCLSDQDADLYFDSASRIRSLVEGSALVESLRLSLLHDGQFRVFRFGASQDPIPFAGPLDIDPKDGYFDTNRDKEILYGDYEGTPQYLDYDGEPFHRPGAKILDPTSYSPHYEEALPFDDFRFDSSTPKEPLLRLEADVPKDITLTLYAEGWDPHLTDMVRGEGFALDLGFLAHFTPR